jgi:sugar phosphate isomerase/epimerase
MKLSCLPVSYFRQIINGQKTIAQWADEAKSLDLDAIDLSVILFKSFDSRLLTEARNDIERRGLSMAVLNTYPDFTHPDAAQRNRQFSEMEHYLSVADQLRAKMIRITAGQAHPQTPRREGIAWAVEFFRRLSDKAEKHHVRLVYENHSKPGVWDYPDFSLPTDIFLEIADALFDTPIGILFDTANAFVANDDPMRLLEAVIDRVVCVHAADTKAPGPLAPTVIGRGIVPFDKIFSRLKNVGYNGWISIEEASGQGPAAVAEAVSYIRNIWYTHDVS